MFQKFSSSSSRFFSTFSNRTICKSCFTSQTTRKSFKNTQNAYNLSRGYATAPTQGRNGMFFLFPMVTACLGMWQVYRLQWKLNLIEKTTERLQEPPIVLHDDIKTQDVKDLEYRRVAMTGHFINKDEMILGPRSRGEGEVGFFVYTPFQRTDGSNQKVIVNRGFVPREMKDAKSRNNPTGQVTIQGLVRDSESAPFGGSMTQNNPEANSWGWVDLAAMAGWTQSEPILIDQIRDVGDKQVWPEPRLPKVDFRNQHLQYALTWFSLSGLSLYMAVFGRKAGLRGKKVPTRR